MSYGALRNEAERDRVLRITEQCFAPGDTEGVRDWISSFDEDSLRAYRNGSGQVVASLIRLDMGQYFGGRAVSMSGVAAVGVSPENRSGGWAKRLMEGYVREVREQGYALSTLYASTQRLYRKAGYEAAGHCYRLSVPPSMWMAIAEAPSSEGVRLRAGGEEDWSGIRACYECVAPMRHGELARGEDIWRYVRARRGRMHECVAIECEDGGIEGYCLYHVEPEPEGASPLSPHKEQIVVVHDATYSTARAAVRLVEFFAGFGTLCREVRFFGGPTMPILQVLRDNNHRAMLLDHWMVRVLDVKRALESRGYPVGVRGELVLDVTDPLFAENTGRWVLRVEDGRGSAERSDAGGEMIGLDERAMAALYTGFVSAREMAGAGRIAGEDSALCLADSMFAASAPMMTVRF